MKNLVLCYYLSRKAECNTNDTTIGLAKTLNLWSLQVIILRYCLKNVQI